MRLRQLTTAGLALVAVCAVLIAAGCGREAPKLTSAWPKADRERTVDAPPMPTRWPYTGAKASSRSAMQRRPLSVKVENSASSRPQSGISRADVVYETISEGGITRFNCIFHSSVPERLGPVRSARLSDRWVVLQYNALFFYSGASRLVNGRLANADLPNLSQDAGVSAPYYRSSAKKAPHNLYMDTSKAYQEAADRRYEVTAKLEPLQYEVRSVESTDPITEVTIPFSDANRVRWTYKKGVYARFNNGVAHIDEASGKQITTENVVVMWAKYDAISRDKVGSTTYDIALGGKGRVSVFRNGRRIDGTWTAPYNAPPKFKDSKGRPIKLTIGRTWFQVIPTNGSITMK